MTSDDVLKEFGAAWNTSGEQAMAYEIALLRRWNAIRKNAVRIYKRNAQLHSQVIDDLLDKLAAVTDERDELRNRLTAVAVLGELRDAIRSAGAAAEKEVNDA